MDISFSRLKPSDLSKAFLTTLMHFHYLILIEQKDEHKSKAYEDMASKYFRVVVHFLTSLKIHFIIWYPIIKE